MSRGFLVIGTAAALGVASAAMAGGFNERAVANFQKEIEPVIGSNPNWKVTLLKDLHKEMTCDEVRQFFPKLKKCDPAQEWEFAAYSGKPLKHPVDQVKFTFNRGKLRSATIVFQGYMFMDENFGKALLDLAVRKWGPLSSDQAGQSSRIWTNADSDMITVTYMTDHWELENGLPTYETGEIDPTPVDEAALRARLAEVLGPATSWKAAGFHDLKRGMSCEAAKAVLPTLSACDPAKDWDFVRAPLQGDRMLAGYQLDFQKGKLRTVTVRLHRHLSKDLVKAVSLELFEQKWGKLGPKERQEEVLTVARSSTYETVQRAFSHDHWEVRQELPEKE